MLSEFLLAGNIFTFIASFPAIRALVKGRDALKGISLSAAAWTLTAMISFDVWYIVNIPVDATHLLFPTLIISLPTDVFWALALIFLLKEKLKYRVK